MEKSVSTKKVTKNNHSLLDMLSHPDRIMYPEKKITKLALAEYYEAVSEWMLPYVADRVLTLVRCPSGREKCFYQKHIAEANKKGPLYPIKIKENEKTDDYSYLKKVDGLIQLVQLGVLEIHLWGSQIKKIRKARCHRFDVINQMWNGKSCETALFIRDQLEEINLQLCENNRREGFACGDAILPGINGIK